MQILSVASAGPTYTYHVFTSSGTLTVTSNGTADVLSVGGGASGGGGFGGGGGGGEIDIWTSAALTTNVTVTIGAGGAIKTINGQDGSNGGTTTFGAFTTSLGGGFGGSTNPGNTGGSGGGGAGASTQPSAGGGASGSNTFAGGSGNYGSNYFYAGGAGGATGAGVSGAQGVGGNGGQGYLLTSIDPRLTSANFSSLAGMTHIGSGAGGSNMNRAPNANTGVSGTGGTGAGNGGNDYDGTPVIVISAATSATSYGSGGGGGGYPPLNTSSGAGYPGLVIVRYLTGAVVATGGNETQVISV